MGLILDTLVSKAKEEITAQIGDDWLNNLVSTLKTNITKINNPEYQVIASSTIDTLMQHQADLQQMGSFTLTLLLQQLANGDSEAAVLTYIKNQADAQELIEIGRAH